MSQSLLIAELLLKYGPALAREIVQIFQKPAPTADDWDRAFKLAEKSYDDYVKPM